MCEHTLGIACAKIFRLCPKGIALSVLILLGVPGLASAEAEIEPDFLSEPKSVQPARREDFTEGLITRSPDQQRTSELFAETCTKPVPCGPASMAYALEILGVRFKNQELAGLPDESGTSNFATLMNYARQKGLHAIAVKLSPGDLPHLHNAAILQLERMGPDQENAMHFVVFAGTVDENTVYVFDPIASSGWRGPGRLDLLAAKMTGNALILSRYPLDLSHIDVLLPSVPHSGGLGGWAMKGLIFGGATLLISALVIGVTRARKRKSAAAGTGLALLIGIFSTLAAAYPAALSVSTEGNVIEKDAATAAEAKYVVGPSVYQAGVLSKGTTLRHDFEIRNPESGPINIRLGKVTCACLKAELAGSGHILPGAKSSIILTVILPNGGNRTYGAWVHISGKEESIICLRISATVKDDTRVSTRELAFSDICRSAEPETRPLRVTHYGSASEQFRITEVRPSVDYLKVAGISAPIMKLLDGNVLEYETRVSVLLDPKSAPIGRFMEKLAITAAKGQQTLAFDVQCTGNVLERVIARPSRIVRIERVLPEEVEAYVKLQATDGTEVVMVKSIEGRGFEVIDWKQRLDPENRTTHLVMRLRPLRPATDSACWVKCEKPPSVAIEIPVQLIVRAAQGGQ